MANAYALISNPLTGETWNGVKRVADNTFIPNHLGSKDWLDYQKWLAEGNAPDPVTVILTVPYMLP